MSYSTVQRVANGSINQFRVIRNDAVNTLNVIAATSNLNSLRFDGLTLSSASSGATIYIIENGTLDASIFNLGDGYACAVGVNSSGTPVRATDPTCVSFGNYVGYCDGYGTLTVAPKQTSPLLATDFGLVGDGITVNDTVHTVMLEVLNARNQQTNHIHYPAGKYLFTKTIGPWPFDMRISGDGTSDYEGRGGNSTSNAPLPGGTTFILSGTGVGVQLGHYLDSNSRNGTVFESIEIAGINSGGNIDIVTMSDTPSITVNGAAKTYTRNTGSFITDGFVIGDTVYWGTAFVNYQNSYRHTITSLSVDGYTMTVSATDMLQVITETLASGATCYTNHYNDVGIECVGDVGVVVRDVRIGGFKNCLSFDGCESCLALNIHFDGIQTSSAGYPLTDQTEDRGADSAFSYRVGTFYFTSGTSGNKNTLQQANFNGASNGWYAAGDGVDNVIRDCAFECGKNFGQVGSVLGLKIQDCSGEGATVSTIKSTGTVYGLTIDNVTGTTNVPLLSVVGVITGCNITNCDCRSFSVPPVSNAANIISLSVTGNTPPDGAGSSVAGQMLDTSPASAGVIETTTDSVGMVGINKQASKTLDVNGEAAANVYSIHAIVDSSSPTVHDGYAVITYNSHVVLANSTNLNFGTHILGLATTTGAATAATTVITGGLFDRTVFNLGDGYACAVGLNANGQPVRSIDGSCVTAPNWIGYCDAYGTITIQPKRDTVLNVLDFGMDPTGTLDNSNIWSLILATSINSINYNHIHFPCGRYRFNSGISMPGGRSIKITGDGISNQLNPNVYKGGSQLLAYGPGIFITWGTPSNNESGGIAIEDLEILGQLNNGFVDGYHDYNQIGLELLGVVGATIRRCRFGSFQYQISIDGAEGTHIEDCQFDGGGDGNGYQDVATNLDGCNQLPITVATATSPIAVTFDGYHNMGTGSIVTISGSNGGLTGLLGTFTFTKTGATTGTLNGSSGSGSYGGSGAFGTSGIDSAFAIRIGSFNFTVGNSANEAYITNCNFNNSRWGILHQDGVTHIVDSCTYELAGGMAVCGSPENLVYTKCGGENAHVANFWFTDWHRAGKSQTFCFELIGNFLGIAGGLPVILIDPNYGEIIGIDIRGNLLFTSGVPAISNAAGILGNVSQGGNYLVGPFTDGQTDASQIGTTLNDLSDPTAVMDTVITTYGYPTWKFRVGTGFIFSQGPTISSGAGTQFDQFEQLLHSANAPSTRYQRGLLYRDVVLGASPTAFTILAPSDGNIGGSGVFVVEVSARWQSDSTKMVYWKIRQLFNVSSGTVNLLSQAATLDSDMSIDGTFIEPTISASSGNLQITITGHPTEATSWSVRGYIVEVISQ